MFKIFDFKQWKAQTQIICLSLFLASLLLIILYIFNVIVLQYYVQQLQLVSSQIFEKESINQLKRNSYYQENMVHSQFTQKQDYLFKINNLFLFTQHYLQIEEPIQCLFNAETFDSYAIFCVFCYDYCNKTSSPEPKNYKDMLNLISLLSELRIIFLDWKEGFVLLADTGIDQLYAEYSANQPPQNFIPHERQWYKDHISAANMGKTTSISEPFYAATVNTIYIAFTQSLVKLDNSLNGVVVFGVNSTNVPVILKETFDPYIIDYNGKVILSKFYTRGMSTFLNIYDEEITGFSEEIWDQIILRIDEKIIKIYNSAYKKEIILSIGKLSNFDYYTVMFFDDSLILKDQEQLFEKHINFYQDFNLSVLGTILACIPIILLIQIIIIKCLMGDINNLQFLAQNQVMKYIKLNYKRTLKNNSCHKLYEAYYQLIERVSAQNQKSVICKQIESIEYPIKISRILQGVRCYIKQSIRNWETMKHKSFSIIHKVFASH